MTGYRSESLEGGTDLRLPGGRPAGVDLGWYSVAV
jgi:hypothetical protein